MIDHNPELLEWVRETFPDVKAVANAHDRGVVGARNTGVELAQGEIVVLTDDDTEAEPDWLAGLESCFADPDVVGVTGELLPSWSSAEPTWFPHEFYWVFGCSYAGLPSEVAPVRNPIAANMAVRRWALQEIGGFRQGVTPRQIRHRGAVVAGGHALEDTELGIRIGRQWPQMKWLYQPHATRPPPRQRGAGHPRLPAATQLRGGCRQGSAGPGGRLAGRARVRAPAPARGRPPRRPGWDRRPPSRQAVRPRPRRGDRARHRRGRARLRRRRTAGPPQRTRQMSGRDGQARRSRTRPTSPRSSIVEVEISAALPRLVPGTGEGGRRYGSALCLVRLHSQPLGMIEVELPPAGLDPTMLAGRIERELGPAIDAHVRDDDLQRQTLGAGGLTGPDLPLCLQARQQFLARAPMISVVIPTRDRPQRAAEAIASVLACDYPADRFEVILVDNRPDAADDTASAATGTLSDERVRVLHEPVPGGANARNTGLAHAASEIVAFTDDDVVADRDWLITIAKGFDGEPGVGAVSGLVAPLEMETQAQVWFEGYARFSGRFHRRAYDLGPNRPDDDPLFPFDIGVLGTGANMAFRVEALRQAGALDPSFNTKALPNGTDVEALLRVMLHGWTIVHDPGAIVQHAHQREYHQLERRVYGYGLGLTAVLTKSLLQNPKLIPELIRKLPRGLAFALSPGSAKNADKKEDFPAELTRLELRGMLRGPLAYARGRREAKRVAQAMAAGSPAGGSRA